MVSIYIYLCIIVGFVTIAFVLSKADPRKCNGDGVIRKSLMFGAIVGSFLFLIYGFLGRHEFTLDSWLWCFFVMTVASLFVDHVKNEKQIKW